MKLKMKCLSKWGIFGMVAVAAVCVMAVILLIFKPWEIRLAEVCAVSLNGEKQLIAVGERVPLELKFTMLDLKKTERIEKKLSETEFVWTSSDDGVATVDSDGTVTGKNTGTALIRVEGGGLMAEYSVEVYRKLEDVTISAAEISANVGEKAKLSYELKPSNADKVGEAIWSSANPEIAEITSDGWVKMKSPGKTQIRLSLGGFDLTCTVTVYAPLKDILLNKDKLELIVGETDQLTVSLEPVNTTDDTTVIFSSADETVATVDAGGTVTAVSPGKTTLSAKIGAFVKTCEVTVTAPMTAFSIRATEMTLKIGAGTTLTVSIEPENTTDDRTIIWSSSNPAVVSVDASGKVVAKGAGTATITAVCNGFTSECRITVIVPVTSVSISRTSATMNKGETLSLTAAVGPANTTEDRSISWSSDNTAVATVKNGVVTAKGPGTAKITASHGNYYASCTVTVYSPMSGIEPEQSAISVIAGYTGKLGVRFVPADTTDARSVSWSSGDEAIAIVDVDGVVTGVSEGECEITATCGAFSAVFSVTVLPYVEVEEITLDITEWQFEECGATKKLTAEVLPADASFGNVTFTTADPKIATVSADGVVTGVGEGTTVITATAGGKSVICTVHVPKPDVVIVLDPGHGGRFPGACYFGYMEKDVNLKVAWYCRQYLEENYKGIKIYMTREDDRHLLYELNQDLEQRAQFAQDKGASLLVSFHFNASNSHNMNGCLVISSHRSNVKEQCTALANSVLRQLSALGIRNKGILVDYSTDHYDEAGRPLDGYAINRHCANRGIPGIIIEHCYLDSNVDKKFFDSEEALQRLGVADALGIAEYLGLEKK